MLDKHQTYAQWLPFIAPRNCRLFSPVHTLLLRRTSTTSARDPSFFTPSCASERRRNQCAIASERLETEGGRTVCAFA